MAAKYPYYLLADSPEGVKKEARNIYEAIKDSPGFIKADFHFEGEAELYFTQEALPTATGMGGAKKKRQLTSEQKAELVKRGSANRFKSQIDGVEDRKTPPI